MTLTLQIQLLPDAEQARMLRATVERFNEAARWLAGKAFELHSANKIRLQRLHYRELRERFELSAQMAVRCIAQTCEAYKRDKSIRPTFRPHASVPYDQRLMSFKGIDRVSLLTLEGRVLVPLVMGCYQRERFSLAKGQSDLVLRKNGTWLLLVTVNLPDGTPIPATDWIGVDLGVVNIAVDSDGNIHSGTTVERIRQQHQRHRNRLQPKKSRGAKKLLKRLAGREARFRRHQNHCISKTLVTLAKDTVRGLALEDLKGIRERARLFRMSQRARLSGWSFNQLRLFVEYKARLAGVELQIVEARHTSRTCPKCGHCKRANRKSQALFVCRQCDYSAHADFVGARNIRDRAARKPAPELSRLVA